jgi:hypothetical protein
MVQVIERNDIFGRIGKNLGEGFGEQVGRNSFAKGLEKITGNKDIAELARYSGGLENASTILPYIQGQREQAASRSTNGQPSDLSSVSTVNQPTKNQQESGEIPPKFDRDNPNYLVRDPAELIDQRADEISKKFNIPFARAQEIEQRKSDKRFQSEQDFETRATLGSQELNKEVEQFIQKSGNEVYKELTGELLGQYDTMLRNDIANGASPVQSARKRAKELLELARVRGDISVDGVKKAYQSSASQSRNLLQNAREDYKKAKQLDLYKRDLVGKIGMRPAFASALAYPSSEHQDIVPYIKSYRKNADSSYEKISKYIDKNKQVSLLSTALAIQENGGDGQKFLDKISADRKAGRIDLTDRQKEELREPFIFNPSLTDIWYTSLFGKRAGI